MKVTIAGGNTVTLTQSNFVAEGATAEELLVEGNNWNDTFWGVCRGRGENNLGRILMKVRSEVKTERTCISDVRSYTN